MLDSSVWLFHQTQSAEIQRLLQGHIDRVAGCDAVDYDVVRGVVVYSRQGRPVFRYRVEVIGVYRPEARVFRWGTNNADGSLCIAAIKRDGEAHGLAQLLSGSLPDLSETDAERLAQLGAHLAGAAGVYRHAVRLGREGQRYHYLALFDGEAIAHRSTPPQAAIVEPAPVQTLPPAAPDGSPCLALARKVRSPRQSLLAEVAGVALPLLRKKHPRFMEAIFVIRVDLRQTKARFFTTLSVIDVRGQLQVVEPTTQVMGAAARLIADDHNDGNGRWERLMLRLAGDALDAIVLRAEAA